jgi:hypothetical protein
VKKIYFGQNNQSTKYFLGFLLVLSSPSSRLRVVKLKIIHMVINLIGSNTTLEDFTKTMNNKYNLSNTIIAI